MFYAKDETTRMRDIPHLLFIFKRASNVCIWLDADTNKNVSEAFAVVQLVSRLKTHIETIMGKALEKYLFFKVRLVSA
jgi:hypothetical protein